MNPKYSRKELLAMKDVLLTAQEIEPLAYVSLLINGRNGERGILFYTGVKEMDDQIQSKIHSKTPYIASKDFNGVIIRLSPQIIMTGLPVKLLKGKF